MDSIIDSNLGTVSAMLSDHQSLKSLPERNLLYSTTENSATPVFFVDNFSSSLGGTFAHL